MSTPTYTPRPAPNCRRDVLAGPDTHHDWRLTESNVAAPGEPPQLAEFYECRRCGALELLT